MKKLLVLFSVFTLIFMSTGCSSSSNESSEKKVIRIGGTSTSEVYYHACKEDFEKKGFKTEFIPFDSNPVCLEACNSGDIDISIGQHKKFVESFNKNKSGDLAMAKPYVFYTGIGLYSEKHKDIKDIPDGAKIAIMNDPMNGDVSLRILDENGLIKLKPGLDLYTPADLEVNPKNIEIIEMDQGQTITALQDLDASCVFFTFMSGAGKDPLTYLARDTQMVKYPLGVIVKKDNADSKWATEFAKSMRTDKAQDEINKEFPGVFIKYNNDSEAE